MAVSVQADHPGDMLGVGRAVVRRHVVVQQLLALLCVGAVVAVCGDCLETVLPHA